MNSRNTILLLFFCLLFAAEYTQAQQSPQPYRRSADYFTLTVDHYNTDGILDTLVGEYVPNGDVLVRAIVWGVRPAVDEKNGSVRYASVKATQFIYPAVGATAAGAAMYCSIAAKHYDADSLGDIVFYLHGTEVQTNANRTTQRKDFWRAIALFGQEGLDTVAFIPLWEIKPVQAFPFKAMHLRKNIELREGAVRDFSGRLSYVLPGLKALNIHNTDTLLTPPEIDAYISESGVLVFPNPTAGETNIMLRNLPPDDYTLILCSLEGREMFRQQISIQRSGESIERISAELLPTGYYLLRIISKGGSMKSSPMVVYH